MTREEFLGSLLGVVVIPLAACSQPTAPGEGGPDPTGPTPNPNPRPPEVQKTEAEWRALLTPAAYAILFEGRTEPPGHSPLASEYGDGTYVCAACFLPLFQSTVKYDSGTGWPSFWQPISADRVDYHADNTLSDPRTEYHCSRCGGHHGHVFNDGPPPTGLRYCNNGLALHFVPKGQVLPALRY